VLTYNQPCHSVEVIQGHTSAKKQRFLLKTEEPANQENSAKDKYLSYQTIPSIIFEHF